MQALSQLSYTPNSLPSRSYNQIFKKLLAEWTGLEPATPGVTGRYSNQLNYHSALKSWRPHGDSNPGYRRERAVS